MKMYISYILFFQTEQIRRVNRLWASDSLFLREHLFIPINPESPLSLDNTEEIEHNIVQNVIFVYININNKLLFNIV